MVLYSVKANVCNENMASASKKFCTEEKSNGHLDNPFIEEPGITDCALVVEGRKIFVNKGLLAISSPVFKAMFLSDFKEKRCKEIKLPGKSFVDVVDFLKVIYPNMGKPLDVQTVIRLLPLLHEYNCKRQLEECQLFLRQAIDPDKKNIDIDTLLLCMHVTDAYGLAESFNNCIEQGAKHSSSSLINSNVFQRISSHIREKIFFKRLIMLEKDGKELVLEISNTAKCGRCSGKTPFKKLALDLDTTFDSYMGCTFKYVKNSVITAEIEKQAV